MRRRPTGFVLVILLFLFGCSRLPPPPAIPSPLPTPMPRLPSATPDAVITQVQGEVNLQQVITGEIVMASFGGLLWRGDTVKTGQEARAEILCSDGDSIRIDANQSVTITCGETPDPDYQRLILRVHQEQIEALPSTRPAPPDDKPRPVVFSPRSTYVIEPRPTIRWSSVERAEAYEVIVRKVDRVLWWLETQESELVYPETEPALQAGETYTIEVHARLESGERLPALESVWLAIPSEAEMEETYQFEAQIKSLDLSAESARFLLASYFADRELYDAALAELIPLAEATDSPVIHRLLADIYLAIELYDQAGQSYQVARQLAQAQNNPLVEAEAEVGLGHVAYAKQEFPPALDHYRTALTLYQKLNLDDSAEVVAGFVADVKLRLPTPTPE